MFDNFPYTDMHQLNLDWIIKIAKDFLDQYTTIQQLISDGEQSLQDLTTEGLNDLQEKADHLQELLDAWYNEHSQDITDQLADALQDLADALNTTITSFNAAADAKSQALLDSWPSDYSQLVTWVDELRTKSPIYRGATTTPLAQIDKAGMYSVAKANAATIGLPAGMVANYGYLYADMSTGQHFYLIENSNPPLLWEYRGGNWFNFTDTSLSKAGIPADAKAVSDALYAVYRGAITDFSAAKPGISTFSQATVTSPIPEDMHTTYGFLYKLTNNYMFIIESATNPTIWYYNGSAWIRLNNKLSNKKITFIGDSITEYNDTATYNYVKIFETVGNCTVQNLGRSGVGYCRYHDTNSNFISKIPDIDSDTDIIMISGSFNDLGSSEPLGNPTDTGTTTICGYINQFYDALFTAFPTKQIVCCSMNYWVGFGTNSARFTNYVDALKTICRNRAIPFLDVGEKCNIRPWIADNATAYCPDGTHPNNDGHLLIYPIISSFVESLIN